MTREKDLERCIAVLVHNLRGQGFDSLKPMSVQMCNQLADYAEAIYFGASPEEAERKVKDG